MLQPLTSQEFKKQFQKVTARKHVKKFEKFALNQLFNAFEFLERLSKIFSKTQILPMIILLHIAAIRNEAYLLKF